MRASRANIESTNAVRAGWFQSGGTDPTVKGALPERRLWLDRFVIRRHLVTNAEYIAFLDDLVARGDEAEQRAAKSRAQAKNNPLVKQLTNLADAIDAEIAMIMKM